MDSRSRAAAAIAPAATASAAQCVLESTRAAQHAHCLFCGGENPLGFKLDFQVRDDGSVRASFPCGELFQSYPGMIHGGVIAALLDAAMTNCLFSKGVSAVTGQLSVRFLQPVNVESAAEITAFLVRKRGRVHLLGAEITQNRAVVARASATFVENSARPERPRTAG